jgi:hypothetical protein
VSGAGYLGASEGLDLLLDGSRARESEYSLALTRMVGARIQFKITPTPEARERAVAAAERLSRVADEHALVCEEVARLAERDPYPELPEEHRPPDDGARARAARFYRAQQLRDMARMAREAARELRAPPGTDE